MSRKNTDVGVHTTVVPTSGAPEHAGVSPGDIMEALRERIEPTGFDAYGAEVSPVSDLDVQSEEDAIPTRRRDARLLVTPFLDLIAVPYLAGVARTAEMVVDLSRRGLSFYTHDEDLMARADEMNAVTVECPDGLSAVLGVAKAHVRRTRPDAPARVALEFDVPRPAFRTPARLRRVAGGFYAPARRADTPALVRAILGVDPTAAERRSADRIRVSFESKMMLRFEGVGWDTDVMLADVSPHGFGCFGPAGFRLPGACERVRLSWEGRELLSRPVRATFSEPVTVRGEPRTRLRVILSGGTGNATRWLPAWAGSREFGSVRVAKSKLAPGLVQAVLLARQEVTIAAAVRAEEIEAALQLSHQAYVEDGFVDPGQVPWSRWRDDFDDQATVLVARAGDLLAGTIRLVPEGERGLPHQHWSAPDHWPAPTGRRVEASRLAVSHVYRPSVNAQIGVAVLLITAAVRHCLEQDYDVLIMGTRLEHEGFYRSIGLEPVSEPFVHLGNGVISRMLQLDLRAPHALRWFRRFFPLDGPKSPRAGGGTA